MKKRYILLTTIFVCLFMTIFNTFAIAQTEITYEEFEKEHAALNDKIRTSADKKDYAESENLTLKAIALFNRLSQEDQKNTKWLQGENYYNLACYTSLQKKTKEAIDAFSKAVNEYGWGANYLWATKDKDLDNIRSDKRFISLMQRSREKGDYIYILQQSGKYQQADTTGLARFTYQEMTNRNLREVRNFFKLDSIAGQGNEISKIINVMNWVHNNIRHNGNNWALCEFDAIDIYNYHKSTGKGVNCRQLAITLNEMYLSLGIKSRYITCLPKSTEDQDCHVINSVYSDSLKKWIWIDPTFNAYIKDEKGNLLGIEEVRERLIDERPLVLNEDANWNNQNKQTKEHYIDTYMAKNLYWLQCPVNSCFNTESRYRYTNQPYVSLRPYGDEGTEPKSTNNVVTHDAAYFWEH